jgi:hypothetical protein
MNNLIKMCASFKCRAWSYAPISKKCIYNLSHMDLTKYHEHLIDDEKVNLEFLTRKHDLESLQVVHENLCSRMNLLCQSKLMKSKKASTLLV